MQIRHTIAVGTNNRENLLTLVAKASSLGPEKVSTHIVQGSVWEGPLRCKDPAWIPEGGTLVFYQGEFSIAPYFLSEGDVAYEDEEILAVRKPPNLCCVPNPFSDLDCLVHGVQNYLDRQGSSYRVNAVHRLDYPAQGLVLFGKNKVAEKALHRIFHDRRIKKIYFAQTEIFSLKKTEGTLRTPLKFQEKVQTAFTIFKLLGEGKNFFRFAVGLSTGRNHQIRKHFAEHLRPLRGDVLYGDAVKPALLELACVYLRFRHPVTGKVMEVYRPPENFGICDA